MKKLKDIGIRYREYREGDFPAIRTLWRDDARWGDLTPEMWRQWYVDVPGGPAIIVVGEHDDGRIVAQAAMTPYRLMVGDDERRAAHLAAPIVSRHLQGTWSLSANHPGARLLMACNRIATRHGVAVMFGMPRMAWLALLRMAPLVGIARFPGTTFRCFQVSLSDPPPPQPERLSVRRIDHFCDEYDQLWRDARCALPIRCGVIRDAACLNYRNGGHLCLEMRDRHGDRLVGYTAVRSEGQLMDMLTPDASAVTDMIAATWRYLVCDADRSRTEKMTTFRVMETPTTAEALGRLKFSRIRFRFAFACRALDDSLADRVLLKHWYLTPNG
jgi:hypothetical protein